jgi:nucleotide-binding universal stress UspA family protein
MMEKLGPKQILCPTDFSETANLALRYAKVMAERFQSRLLVLYAEAYEPPPYFTADQQKGLLKAQARSRKAAAVHLSRQAKELLGESVEAETIIVEDHPASGILKTAASRGVDWIVMGTHGRSGWRRAMLGSTTERVLRETEKPVLTVRHKEGENKTFPSIIQKILCPVNYSEVAQKALAYAATLAERFSAELRVLTVIESPGEDSEEGERERLCAWIPGGIRPRCQIQEMIRRGDAGEQILKTAGSDGCDLIVLGAQHKRFWDSTIIGRTTMNVIRHAPCPVFTVVQKM